MRTPGEIADLWTRFKTDTDSAARTALIEEYTYLVRITGRRVAPGATAPGTTIEQDDLFSAGAIGLINAVDRYDPARPEKFETLAIALIRGAILEHFRGQDTVPRSIRARIKAVLAGALFYEQEHGRPPTDAELALTLGMEEADVVEARKDLYRSSPLSLDGPCYSDDDRTAIPTHGDTVLDREKSHQPELAAVQRTQKEQLSWAIDHLPERERLLISLYFFEGLSCPEIAPMLGVSDNRAHQIYHRALARLRQYLGHQADLFDVSL